MNEYDEINTREEEETLADQAKLDGAARPFYADVEYAEAQSAAGKDDLSVKEETQEDIAEPSESDKTDDDLKKSAVNGIIGDDIEKTPEENEPSASEKNAFESSAKIFGVSEDQMVSEFKNYKVGKLFRKMGVMLTDPYMRINEFENTITSAITMGLDSVSVLPNRLPQALKAAGDKIKVYVCISFPYAVDDFKTKYYSLKKVVKSAAYGVEIPLNIADLSERKLKAVVKEYEKLKKTAKNKDFVIIADIARTSPTDIGALAKICADAGIKSVKTSCALYGSKVDEYALNNLRATLGENVEIIASSAEDDGKRVVEIFAAGVDKFTAPNAIDLAKVLKGSM